MINLSGIQVMNICLIMEGSAIQMLFLKADKIVHYSDHRPSLLKIDLFVLVLELQIIVNNLLRTCQLQKGRYNNLPGHM